MLGVVILAAGASSRMGRPKMLLPWKGTTVLGHLISTWEKLKAGQVAVVVAANDRDVVSELDRCRFPIRERIINPSPERGMFSSIQTAAKWGGWRARIRNWAIVLGDQPHLGVEILQRLLEHCGAHADDVCQPSLSGRPKHPVILPGRIFQQLAEAGDDNFKEFLRRVSLNASLCEINDPTLDFDIDYPADYEEALERFGGSSSTRG